MGDSPNPFGTTVLLPPDFMIGAIILWSGAIVDIPAGWQLCDGTNGTPDLRNRFIVGAGDQYTVGISDGKLTQTHTFTGDGHGHNLILGITVQDGSGRQHVTDSQPAVGTTDPSDNRPPYYSLAYIQRMFLV